MSDNITDRHRECAADIIGQQFFDVEELATRISEHFPESREPTSPLSEDEAFEAWWENETRITKTFLGKEFSKVGWMARAERK